MRLVRVGGGKRGIGLVEVLGGSKCRMVWVRRVGVRGRGGGRGKGCKECIGCLTCGFERLNQKSWYPND